jgi:hypothetical protein
VPVSNTLLTNDIITYEALDVLENTLAVLINLNAEYSDQFQFGGAVLGQTLRIRKPPRYIGRLGQAAQIEAITETEVPLTLSFQRGVDTQVSSQQLSLDIDNYRTRVLKPQIARLANLIDQDCCNLAQGLNNFVGTPGITPATLSTYGRAKVKLDNMAAPPEDRCMFLNPIADFTLMDNLKGLFNTAKEISAQYDSGSMVKSNTIGADWYMDQNIYVQTIGALGASTPIVSVAPVTGATTVTTTGWVTGTLNAGDVISFVSTTTPVNGINPQSFQSTGETMQFVVTATTSDTAGTMVIPFAPALIGPGSQLQNVTNLPAVNTPVFVYDTPAASFATIAGKQSPQNMAVHHDFGTIAMVDLPLPGGTDRAYRAASRKSGKSIRVIRDYVATTDQWIQRIDVLYGTAILRQELGCRVGG